jgi:hypothetical protein
MAGAIVGVSVEDVRTLAGLMVSDTARTDRFTTAAGLQLDITFVDADGGPWAIFKASAAAGSDAEKDAAAINARTGQWAFKLDASRMARLTRAVGELVQNPADRASGAEAPPPGMIPPGFVPPPGMRAPEMLFPGVPAPTSP